MEVRERGTERERENETMSGGGEEKSQEGRRRGWSRRKGGGLGGRLDGPVSAYNRVLPEKLQLP